MPTWEDVRRLALALPEATEDSSHGSPSWKVRGKTFVWDRPLRQADLRALGPAAPDGPVLGVRVPGDAAKQALLADAPDWCFTVPHFDGYPAVLVLLDLVPPDELAELVVEAWLDRAPVRLAKAWRA